jgi:hypothetical protein
MSSGGKPVKLQIANDRDADIRENIDRRPDRREGAKDRNQDRHNHKCIGAPERQSHDGWHGVGLERRGLLQPEPFLPKFSKFA